MLQGAVSSNQKRKHSGLLLKDSVPAIHQTIVLHIRGNKSVSRWCKQKLKSQLIGVGLIDWVLYNFKTKNLKYEFPGSIILRGLSQFSCVWPILPTTRFFFLFLKEKSNIVFFSFLICHVGLKSVLTNDWPKPTRNWLKGMINCTVVLLC